MGWLVFWVALSVVVAVAAQHRGRSPIAWGLIALVVSPVIGLLLVLVMNRIDNPGAPLQADGRSEAAPKIEASPSKMFDGVISGRPYRKTADGMIEVNTGAGMKRYENLEKATAAVMRS